MIQNSNSLSIIVSKNFFYKKIYLALGANTSPEADVISQIVTLKIIYVLNLEGIVYRQKSTLLLYLFLSFPFLNPSSTIYFYKEINYLYSQYSIEITSFFWRYKGQNINMLIFWEVNIVEALWLWYAVYILFITNIYKVDGWIH